MPTNDTYTTALAAHLFAVANNNYEPQRTNNFELAIVGLSNIYAAGCERDNNHGFTQAEYKLLQNSGNELTLSIQGAFTPQENISKLEVPYGNSSVKFAGKVEYPDGTITWTDYYHQDMELLLKCWLRSVYNGQNGAVGDATDYKCTAYVT